MCFLGVGESYDNLGYRQELADVFAELSIKWKWQPITLENIHAAVEEVAASSKEYIGCGAELLRRV